MYAKNDHRDWDTKLPEIAFAINTARHESTHLSAAEINLGRNPSAPKIIAAEINTRAPTPPVDFTELYKKAMEANNRATQRQRKYYNQRHRQWKPAIGSLVYRKNHIISSAAHNFTEKLAPKFIGPYQVIKFISPTIVLLQDTPKGKPIKVQLQDLKECNTILCLIVSSFLLMEIYNLVVIIL